ncbi:MAG: SIS domain-containing protein [Chthonomonadales bacterium]
MTYTQEYLSRLKGLIDEVQSDEVDQFIDLLDDVWKNNRRALFMGNGGSSATVSHMVNDFQKCMHLECGRPMRTLCLSDCTPLVMSWANDTEYSNIFQPQVECWAEPGDLVIGVSGSGNSENVIRGIVRANELGANTFGLAGYDGGRLVELSKHSIHVKSFSMQQVEDMHTILFHIAFSAVRDRNVLKP